MINILDRLRSLYGGDDEATPARDGTETCTAETCVAVGGRSLPYGDEQMRRCQVPPQSDKTSALKPTTAVLDARPDLTPVWCPDGCGWLHSVCYSTHHAPGWTPARDLAVAVTG